MSALLLVGLILAAVGLLVWFVTAEKTVGKSMTAIGVVLAVAAAGAAVSAPTEGPPANWRPTRKVSAVALAAAVWTLVVAILSRAGVDLGTGVEAAAGGLLTLLAGYWTPEGT